MKRSDAIAQYLLGLLAETGSAEIRRNELATMLGCVPSQISYVLTSRFTPEQGYLIESQRGGGGYIRITRIYQDTDSAISHLLRSIGNNLDMHTAQTILHQLQAMELLEERVLSLLLTATADRSLVDVPKELRDTVRARLFKNLLLQLR